MADWTVLTNFLLNIQEYGGGVILNGNYGK